MKRTLLISSLIALAIPAAAMAQPYDPACVRENQNNRVAGTVLGAIGGAVIGGAVAGNGHKNDGAVVGALGGAVAGNAIAGSQGQPCPNGYVRVERRDQGPPPPQARNDYRDNRDHRDYGDRRDHRDFWDGAPQDIRQRIEFMQQRVNRSIQSGWLSRRESRDITNQMRRLRQEDRRLEYQDHGRLRPQDRAYLDGLLNNLSQRLHWAEHN